MPLKSSLEVKWVIHRIGLVLAILATVMTWWTVPEGRVKWFFVGIGLTAVFATILFEILGKSTTQDMPQSQEDWREATARQEAEIRNENLRKELEDKREAEKRSAAFFEENARKKAGL